MRTVVKMQFGSHVYGTNVPGSDLDYKAIHLPQARDILLGTVRETITTSTKVGDGKNTSGDIDVESFSVGKYMKLLLEGQTVALDMLFCPDEWISESSELWDKIRAEKEFWLHKGVSSFVGYCRQQANKYGIKGSRVAAARKAVHFFEELMAAEYAPSMKLIEVWDEVIDFVTDSDDEHIGIIEEDSTLMLEVCNRKVQSHASIKMGYGIFKRVFDEYGKRALQAETNEGVDWKALMHAVRVCEEAKELLSTGRITFPRPERQLLLKIRSRAMEYKEVAEIIEKGMSELEYFQTQSILKEKPDKNAAESLVCDAYKDVIQNEYTR